MEFLELGTSNLILMVQAESIWSKHAIDGAGEQRVVNALTIGDNTRAESLEVERVSFLNDVIVGDSGEEILLLRKLVLA